VAALAVFALFFLGRSLSPAIAQDAPAADQREAKKVFGAIKLSQGEQPKAIGQYDRGCIEGAKKLSMNGPGWQTMRPSRNRVWGHPALLRYIQNLAADVRRLDGWPGILVGDMAQPIGGPLLGGHASHQIGLDVDLWMIPMPTHTLTVAEREQLAASDMVDEKALTVNKAVWGDAQVKLLRRAASYGEVARIFVHPAIKKALCEAADTDRGWLRKIRPWWKHNDHFHVRLNCPQGSPHCVAQAPIAEDDGCGAELDKWFERLREAPRRPSKPLTPSKPMLIADLPKECQALVAATEKASESKRAAN
jgi:penicillin-insensitive murein endopeptidase